MLAANDDLSRLSVVIEPWQQIRPSSNNTLDTPSIDQANPKTPHLWRDIESPIVRAVDNTSGALCYAPCKHTDS